MPAISASSPSSLLSQALDIHCLHPPAPSELNLQWHQCWRRCQLCPLPILHPLSQRTPLPSTPFNKDSQARLLRFSSCLRGLSPGVQPWLPLPPPPLPVYSLSYLHTSDRHLDLTQPNWTRHLPLPHHAAPTILLITIRGNVIFPVASPINCQCILGSSITAYPRPAMFVVDPIFKVESIRHHCHLHGPSPTTSVTDLYNCDFLLTGLPDPTPPTMVYSQQGLLQTSTERFLLQPRPWLPPIPFLALTGTLASNPATVASSLPGRAVSAQTCRPPCAWARPPPVLASLFPGGNLPAHLPPSPLPSLCSHREPHGWGFSAVIWYG